MKYREPITINNQMEIYLTSDDKMMFLISNIIEPTIKELCFSFCVDSQEIYDMLYETYELRMQFKEKGMSYANKEYKEHEHFVKVEFDRLCYIRLQNVIKRFVDMEGDVEFSALMLDQKRIYDDIMHQEMIKVYLRFMHLLYDMEQQEDFYQKVMKRIQKFSEEYMSYDYTRRIDRENKYTLFEAIFYCSILCCTEKRSVNTINKVLKRGRERKRAEKWFSNFSQAFFSDEMRDALIRTVIAITYGGIPERRRNLSLDDEMYDRMLKKGDYGYDIIEPKYQEKMLIISELIATEVFPVKFPVKEGKTTVELFLDYIDGSICLGDKEKEYMKDQVDWSIITEEIYKYASVTAAIFLRFIDEVLEGTVNLLKCLPESTVVGDKEIFDYLQDMI